MPLDAQRDLVEAATEAELSFNGDVQRLAKLEAHVREPLLPAVAKRHGVTLTTLKRAIQAYVRGLEAGGETQAARLLRLGSGEVELFHTPDGETYAGIAVDGHRETWPIMSRDFRRWLQHHYFEETDSAPNGEAMAIALAGLDARARFAGEEEPVCLRVGAVGDRLYLDLCNANWQVVEITAAGWRVLDESPLRFTRGAGMRALPQPMPGGSLERLRPLLNVEHDAAFRLVIAWLLAGLRPDCAYPVLAIGGEAETAKSTCAKILRALLDPNRAPLRSLPKDEQDLMVSARNAHVLVFDNLSGLPGWLSDAICRLSTGGGLGTRTLYTNAEETIFDGQRPVLLVGIAEIVTQQDLASRAVFLELQPIPAEKRRTEAELLAELATAGPDILGGLLDLAVIGLRQLPNTRLEMKPRMADFAVWASACTDSAWGKGAFLAAYSDNAEQKLADALESDLLATAVRNLLMTVGPVKGQTAAALLVELGYQVTWEQRRSRLSWPATPRALSARLRRLAPALRKADVEVTFTREGHDRARLISISAKQQGTRTQAPPADKRDFASAASAPSSEQYCSTNSGSYSNAHADANADAKANEEDLCVRSTGGADANAGAADASESVCVRIKPFDFNAEDAKGGADAKSRCSSEGTAPVSSPPPEEGLTQAAQPVRRKRPPSPTTVLARELAAKHPAWNPSRIARTLGVAEATVANALKGWARLEAPAPAEEAPT